MNKHEQIESFNVTSVKDISLPTDINGLPFPSGQLRSLLESCPAILDNPDAQPMSHAEDTETIEGYYLQQPTPMHKRSFEIITNSEHEPWQDEYGNIYNALTLKGNNFSDPKIMMSATASEGYIAYGLQESFIIERVLRASELLRSRNIGTEYTIGLAEPKAYPWPSDGSQTAAAETIPLKEYKRRIIDNYWNDLSDNERTPQTLAELYTKFQDMTFYISLRATDTAYRLHDTTNLDVRDKVFKHINAHELKDGDKPLDAKVPTDMQRYLNDYFSPRAGRNFARLHIDLAHKFPHGYNMSALGSIVDLDSVHGHPLGLDDPEVTDFDRATDLGEALKAVMMLDNSVLFSSTSYDGAQQFVKSYFDETIRLHGSVVGTLHNLNGIVEYLDETLSLAIDNLPLRGKDEILLRVQEIYLDKLLSILTEEQMIEVQSTIDTCARAAISDPRMKDKWAERFMRNSSVFVKECVSEYINEITDAATNGQVADILPMVLQDFDGRPSYLRDIATEPLLTEYYDDVEQRIRECLQSSSGMIGSELNDLLTGITPLLARMQVEACQDVIHRQAFELLPTLYEEIHRASQFKVPTPLFDNDVSYLSSGLNESCLWLCTDGVALNDVIDYLLQENMQVEVEELSFGDDARRTVPLEAFAHTDIHEVISDAISGGWSHKATAGDVMMEIFYEESPSYLLLVEVTENGERRLRLQLTAEQLGSMTAPVTLESLRNR